MHCRKNLLITAVMLLSGIFSLTCTAQDDSKKMLRYNFTEGDEYLCVSQTDQSINQTVQGQDMEMSSSVTIEVSIAVGKVAKDGTATVTISYDRMRQVLKGMGEELVIDTNEPLPAQDAQSPDDEQRALMTKLTKAMMGIKLVFEIQPTGNAKMVAGIDQFKQVMQEQMNELDPQVAAAMTQFTDELFTSLTDESIQDMFSQYPEKAIAVGDTWNTMSSFGSGQLPINVDINYTCKEINNGVTKVDINGKIDMGDTKDGSNVIEMEGMKMNMQIKGMVDGYNTIDLKTGMPVDASIKHNFEGNVKMEMQIPSQDGGEPQVQTMDIPMKISGTTTAKITKKI